MKKNSRPLFLLILIATAISVLYTSYITLIKKDFEIVEIEEESLIEEESSTINQEPGGIESENNLEVMEELI